VLNLLPLTMLDEECKIGKGQEQCKFLARQDDKDNYFCLKSDKEKAEIIIAEVESFLRRFRDSNRTNHELPVGDNCPGFRVA